MNPSPRARALRALPFTFVLYVFEALLALLATMPFALEALLALGSHAWDPTQAARTLDAVFDLAPALRSAAGASVLSLIVLGALSPWLQMSWLSALAQARPPLAALAAGWRLILRACLVSLWVLLATALAALPFALAAYFTHRGLEHSTDARFHDLTLLALLAPLALLFAFAWLVHELARASALRFGAFTSVRRALPMALRGGLWLRALGLSAAGYGAIAIAQLQSGWLPASALRAMLVVLALQSALLARTFLRSLWLANALTCMIPELESGPAVDTPTENTRGLWHE